MEEVWCLCVLRRDVVVVLFVLQWPLPCPSSFDLSSTERTAASSELEAYGVCYAIVRLDTWLQGLCSPRQCNFDACICKGCCQPIRNTLFTFP